jgi:hypothetical protein
LPQSGPSESLTGADNSFGTFFHSEFRGCAFGNQPSYEPVQNGNVSRIVPPVLVNDCFRDVSPVETVGGPDHFLLVDDTSRIIRVRLQPAAQGISAMTARRRRT